VAFANPMAPRHRRDVRAIRNTRSQARVWTPAIIMPTRQPPRRPTSSCERQSQRCSTASDSRRGCGERASSDQSGARAIAGREHGDAQYFNQSGTLRSNSCSASIAPWLISTSSLPARPLCPSHDFHCLSRALGPCRNQWPKSSLTPRQQAFARVRIQRELRRHGSSEPAVALAKAALSLAGGYPSSGSTR
jgi:hypothetical protein